jgi:L-amino acid N-acyltransferase YncA
MIARPATTRDVPAMTEVLNAVIAAGGTTAHEVAKPEAEVRAAYVEGPEVLSAVVVEGDGRVLGWQSVGLWQGEPHIGSFVRPGLQAQGAGRAMFALTCAILRARGVDHVIAHIRADNRPGLAYYAKIGFRDIGGDPDFTLQDGRRVGQVFRRFDLC